MPRLDDNEAKFAGLMGNDSEWYFTGAKLFPNVKGCGYPPMLNCSIFYRQYANIGQNFSCYYSKVDPGIVISDLDMWQVSAIFYFSLCVYFAFCAVREALVGPEARTRPCTVATRGARVYNSVGFIPLFAFALRIIPRRRHGSPVPFFFFLPFNSINR